MPYGLPALGFDPFFQAQLTRWSGTVVPARVAAAHRGRYEVWAESGPLPSRLGGGLRRELREDALPGVGDWVVIDPPDGTAGLALMRGVLERRTVFLRGAAGRESRPQVIGANVDLVFVVVGLDAGVNLNGIERYVAGVWSGGATPAVVLNKVDVCPDAGLAASAEVELRCPGVRVHAISALRGGGLESIRAEITEGRTAALVGSSGAGKSTLANALLGEERLATGSVQTFEARGRHTTTRRELVLLPGGGLILDTPGMREFQVVDERGLEVAFGEIAALAAACRFRDCRHQAEPGCAVRQAVASGELDPDRLEHYLKLEREAAAWELRHDVRLRRQAERVWGQLYDEAARLRRWKGKE